MKKFTRRFYNKKLVALGLSSFMGIGLTSTGFAAWVMSKDVNEKPEGNVSVAIVTDASATIDLTGSATKDGNLWTFNDALVFDADPLDAEGRMSYQKAPDTTTNGEDLTMTFSGVLTSTVPYDLTAKLELPAGIVAAMEAGYIQWADGSVDYTGTAKTVELGEGGTFTVTITFAWGAKFNNVNPCYYYDSEEAEDITDAKMNEEMLEFFKVICGLEETPESLDGLAEFNGKFKVTLTASPSASGETVTE